MRKMLVKRILAALLMFAVILSCTGYETVLAAPADGEITLETVPDTDDEAFVSADEINGPALAAEEEPAADEETGNVSNSTEDASPVSEGTTGEGLKIKEIEKVPAKDRIITVSQKGTEEEAISALPETWPVTFEDGTKKDVKVSWKCIDDFDDSNYASFVFAGSIDDAAAAPIDEDMAEDLRMEIKFEDAVETDGEFIIERLSKNSLTTLLDKEQGIEGRTAAFTNAYGSGDEISTPVDFVKSGTGLTESAYNIFKGISPTPDNYLYNKLTIGEKSFYNAINNAVADYLYNAKPITYGAEGEPLTELIPSKTLNETQMRKVFTFYYYDNPQAFFLSTRLSITGDSEYDLSMRVTLYPDTDTPSKLIKKAENIAKNIKSMSKKVRKASGEYLQAKEAQKLLCQRLTFDTERSTTKNWQEWVEGTTMYDKSIMSVFSGSAHKTIDGGYSKAFTAIVRLSGMDAFGINSSPANPRYSDDYEWNKIRVYGEWFCADLTADDTDDITGDGCTYEHFLKSDKTINADNIHAWDEKWKQVAPPTVRDYNPDKTKRYKITYKLNGGTNSIYNPSHYTANSTKITLRDPEKKGRKFGGWYTDDDFDHRIRTISGSEKKDYTIYAKWILIKYKIKYELPKDAKNAKGNPKHYYANSKTIKLKDPTRKGYKFEGWYTDANFTERIKKIKGSDCTDYTVYPKFEPIKYKLRYKITKDVDNSVNPDYYTVETKTLKLKDPTRPGYDFKGWYKDSDLDSRIRKIETKNRKEYTLYPKWKIRKFKITYVLNGGKNNSENPKKYTVKSSKFTLKAPTRSGYKFKGWYTDPLFTNRIKKIRPTDVCDYTLYAKWE